MTWCVTNRRDDQDMETRTLQVGDQVKCKHCDGWHATFTRERGDGRDSPYEKAMLWITCGGARFYMGHVGTFSMHPSRAGRDGSLAGHVVPQAT